MAVLLPEAGALCPGALKPTGHLLVCRIHFVTFLFYAIAVPYFNKQCLAATGQGPLLASSESAIVA